MASEQQPRKENVDFGRRKRELEFRRDWFHVFRSRDARQLTELWISALQAKRKMVDAQRGKSDHLAAYGAGPSAAGTPWFSIGPRNINGRVKCLAIHPTNAGIVFRA